ncbi:MAG: hypothetical protein JWM14_932 [Chitinophagaceae bacterium]|nr:hypothetical protein [Chitinophagaceae bacterium]
MKKLMNYASLLFIGATVVLSSCKKSDDPVPSSNPDVKVTMNETDGTGGATNTIGVKNDRGSVLMQVTAVTATNNDMSRLYVYVKKDNGAYQSVGFTGFTTDGNDQYYYDIPNANRNNFTLDMSPSVETNTSRVTDEYYFFFTSGSAFDINNQTNVKLGPGKITVRYNPLELVKSGQKLYSICASTGNNAAYNIEALAGVTTSVNSITGAITVTGTNADAVNMLGTATNCGSSGSFSNGWIGQNSTTFIKSNAFVFTNANMNSTITAYNNGGSSTSTVSGVATGDVYIAKLKGGSNYAVLKITNVFDGAGNNDYIEFEVYKY